MNRRLCNEGHIVEDDGFPCLTCEQRENEDSSIPELMEDLRTAANSMLAAFGHEPIPKYKEKKTMKVELTENEARAVRKLLQDWLDVADDDSDHQDYLWEIRDAIESVIRAINKARDLEQVKQWADEG